MHRTMCVSVPKRDCRHGGPGACRRCPYLNGREPEPVMVSEAELYRFAAAAVRFATGVPHPRYVAKGYPVCEWCGTREWHRCPGVVREFSERSLDYAAVLDLRAGADQEGRP